MYLYLRSLDLSHHQLDTKLDIILFLETSHESTWRYCLVWAQKVRWNASNVISTASNVIALYLTFAHSTILPNSYVVLIPMYALVKLELKWSKISLGTKFYLSNYDRKMTSRRSPRPPPTPKRPQPWPPPQKRPYNGVHDGLKYLPPRRIDGGGR